MSLSIGLNKLLLLLFSSEVTRASGESRKSEEVTGREMEIPESLLTPKGLVWNCKMLLISSDGGSSRLLLGESLGSLDAVTLCALTCCGYFSVNLKI